MTILATGIGSMPGDDYPEATRVVWGEVAELPHVVELPSRGPLGDMTGRTLAMVSDLAFDLQPAGWRLMGSRGIDHRRAASMLGQDLDITEEQAQGFAGAVKVQLCGPWTLAATVELPRGDRVLADPGARRELTQALAEAVRAHCDDVRRRLAPSELVVQIDEPALPAVLAGSIATASGFHRHRSVTAQDAAQSLTWVAEAISASGATPVLHCCAAELPFDVLRSVPVEALSFDAALLGSGQYDDLGRWVEEGRQVWLGVVPATDPNGPPLTATDVTTTVLRWWRDLGYTSADMLPSTTVTPTCGLAGASPTWARDALSLCREVARNLSVEQGRMQP